MATSPFSSKNEEKATEQLMQPAKNHGMRFLCSSPNAADSTKGDRGQSNEVMDAINSVISR
jgi:hypothetical protein